MPRGACTFKQRDLVAALKAAKQSGAEVARVEIDRAGRIVVVMGKPAEPPADNGDKNPWDAT